MEFVESMKTGHPAIDKDHKEIFDTLDEVSRAIAKNDRKRFCSLFEDFLVIANRHFKREEAILRKCGFPRYEQHAAYHSFLFDRALAVRDRCVSSADNASMEQCFKEFSEFLVDDVVRGDLDFKSYLSALSGR
ncbi:MAG: hemerythrin domain-containing protein [Rhodospirillales bacterium]|nr:hemerythrin domain-containing protein [Rhodospirillales bacterium]